MKIAVFGAGATGGHFAVLLAQSGVDVSVVVRGATLQAVRSSGLTLRTDSGDILGGVTASKEDVEQAVPGDTGPEHPGERRD